MPASVSQIWEKQIITVTANAVNVAYCDSNRRSLTPPFSLFSLNPPSLFSLFQTRGYFAWSVRPFETTVNYYLISCTFAKHGNIWSEQCGPHSNQPNCWYLDVRHSPCKSHHVICDLKAACSYLVSTCPWSGVTQILTLQWRRPLPDLTRTLTSEASADLILL